MEYKVSTSPIQELVGKIMVVSARNPGWLHYLIDGKPAVVLRLQDTSKAGDAVLITKGGTTLELASNVETQAPVKDMKFDGGKPKWSLLMSGLPYAVEGVVKVLTFGAAKYEAHSWRTVEGGQERYLSALHRHLNAIALHGIDSVDAESGLPHIHHVNTNGLFLAELYKAAKDAE